MTTRKKPAPLRDQIITFLKGREEATLKQIAAATSERDFPSRVTTELNKMRTDTLIECAKKKGKNELWYWLATAQADQSGNTQPAVVQNTGSSASVLPSTPAEGAAVQPEPAPAATAPSTAAPVAEDEIQAGDEMPPADPTLLALANRELSDRLARVAHVLRGSGLEALKGLDAGADLQPAVAALTGAYQMALADLQYRTDSLSSACAALGKIGERLGTDPDDGGPGPILDAIEKMDEDLRNARALGTKLQHLLDSKTHECEALRREIQRSGTPLAGYLVRAPKRPLRTFSQPELAQAAAMAAARNGSGRGEVFALVPVGRAVRGAEWRSA